MSENKYIEAVERAVSPLLERVFGLTPEGDRKVWFHGQCLNEDSRRLRKLGFTEGSFPVHGRCWLHWGSQHRASLGLCWDLLSGRVGVGLDACSIEHNLGGNFSIPPVTVFWDIESEWARKLARRICQKDKEGLSTSHWDIFSIRFFDEGMWIDLWHPADSWSNKEKKWHRTVIRPVEILFGDRKYSSEVLSEHDVLVPMPEGGYPAHVKLTRDSWRRPRWPFPLVLRRYNVDMQIPIPFEGKGENSWDCGEDALHGQSGVGARLEDAISGVVKSALESRRKYNGNINAVYPAPRMCHEACEACKAGNHDACDMKDQQCRCRLRKPKHEQPAGCAATGV